MNESSRIADQLHRAFFGAAWHGPSVKEVLDGVCAAQAAAHPLTSSHSIWEIVLHLHAWVVEADETVRGKRYESLRGSKDWPDVQETSQVAWTAVLASLRQAEESLEAAVLDLADEKLGTGDRSLYYLLHGIAQHQAYHAGQIALLKKQPSAS